MAKTNFQTIDEYHTMFSGDTLKRMESIRKIIHEEVPEVEECISYQIPCFKFFGYLIYYSAFSNHISLSTPYSDAFWEHFKFELDGYKTSKSVIQFPNDQPLPKELIRKIIVYRKSENETKKKK